MVLGVGKQTSLPGPCDAWLCCAERAGRRPGRGVGAPRRAGRGSERASQARVRAKRRAWGGGRASAAACLLGDWRAPCSAGWCEPQEGAVQSEGPRQRVSTERAGAVYRKEPWRRGEAVALVAGEGSAKVVFPRTGLFSKGRRVWRASLRAGIEGNGAACLTRELRRLSDAVARRSRAEPVLAAAAACEVTSCVPVGWARPLSCHQSLALRQGDP